MYLLILIYVSILRHREIIQILQAVFSKKNIHVQSDWLRIIQKYMLPLGNCYEDARCC